MIQNALYFLFIITCIVSEITRLPETIIPIQYSLKLTIYLDGYVNLPVGKNETFDGVVEIDLDVKESTTQIILHSLHLNFEKEDCEFSDDLGIIEIYDLKRDQDLVTIYLNETVSRKATIKIKYSGNFSNYTFGLFRDRVVYSKPTLLSQSFPVTHKIVPCFNEPWMKAIWNVEITHPVGSVALSNSPEKQVVYSSTIENFKTTKFNTTPIMSSYQLAIIISDYKYTSGYSDSGTLVRVFAPPNKLNKTEYALQVAINSLNKFEIIFDINYPLPKLDLFPVRKFPASAMENWGLIIFSEPYLIGDQQFVEETVIHEVAHQWFGNLVTMDWYTDLWLNEGFSTLYETDSENKLFHDNYKNKFATLETDSPIRYMNIESLRDFINPAGSVIYDKGSSVLNMLRRVIGTWRFRKGVRRYLKENAFKSVNAQIFKKYFADSMPENSPNIDDFLDPWLEQVGYPVVVVKHFNKTHDIVNQQRFDNNYLDVFDQKFATPKWNYTWYIPLWYKNDGQEKEKLMWLKPGESMFINKTTTIANTLCSFKLSK